jgi:hypothetical protein
MKLIIAGSRDFTDYSLLKAKVRQFCAGVKPIIISGCARGADRLGERYAREHGLELIQMPADWEEFGNAAGFVRNEDMLLKCDAVLLFWDGKSKGTQHMARLAIKRGIRMWCVTY